VVFLLGLVQHQVADISWHSLGIDQGFLQTMGQVVGSLLRRRRRHHHHQQQQLQQQQTAEHAVLDCCCRRYQS